MKRAIFALIAALLMLQLCACGEKEKEKEKPKGLSGVEITDHYGKTIAFDKCPERVVALMGSFGEMWLNAGGELVGITDDALSEREITDESIAIVGTVKNPNLELVLSLNPDFVILSADTASQLETARALEDIGVTYGSFHVELFEDYLDLLKCFTELTGKEECYEEKGLSVQKQIDDTLADAEDFSGSTALLIRAYSTGWKAKDSSTLAGAIIADFGFENVIERYDSALEQLSLEEIAKVDPDYIFVTIMGSNIEGTMQMLNEQLESSPVWASLTAVKSDHFIILPQELFHYKPNSRWGESYEYLANVLGGNVS